MASDSENYNKNKSSKEVGCPIFLPDLTHFPCLFLYRHQVTETCGKATRQKCSTMEKSGNICQSSQKADSRWPNMMSGSEAAAADTVLTFSLSRRTDIFSFLHYLSLAQSRWCVLVFPHRSKPHFFLVLSVFVQIVRLYFSLLLPFPLLNVWLCFFSPVF